MLCSSKIDHINNDWIYKSTKSLAFIAFTPSRSPYISSSASIYDTARQVRLGSTSESGKTVSTLVDKIPNYNVYFTPWALSLAGIFSAYKCRPVTR